MAGPKFQILDCYHRTAVGRARQSSFVPGHSFVAGGTGHPIGVAGNFRRILDRAERPVMTDPMPNELNLTPWGASGDRLLREAEAANFLRLSPGTLRQWRYKSQGPTYQKLGSRVSYRFSELVRFVEKSSNDAG